MDKKSLWELIRRDHRSFAELLVRANKTAEPYVVIEGHKKETDEWLLSALEVGNPSLFAQVTGPMQEHKKELAMFSPAISISVPVLVEALLRLENSRSAMNDEAPSRKAV